MFVVPSPVIACVIAPAARSVGVTVRAFAISSPWIAWTSVISVNSGASSVLTFAAVNVDRLEIVASMLVLRSVPIVLLDVMAESK